MLKTENCRLFIEPGVVDLSFFMLSLCVDEFTPFEDSGSSVNRKCRNVTMYSNSNFRGDELNDSQLTTMPSVIDSDGNNINDLSSDLCGIIRRSV